VEARWDSEGDERLAIPAGTIIQPVINGQAPELDARLSFHPVAAKALLAAAGQLRAAS
jgi:hypothetical protein